MTSRLTCALIEPLEMYPLEPLSLSSLVLGHTVFLIVTIFGFLALFGLPVLRGLGLLIGTTRWLLGRISRPWVGPIGLADPERPLLLAGLSPGLARFARQTRTLALELRRRSEQARYWPQDSGESVGVHWWSTFASEIADFSPLMDTRREVFEWLDSGASLGEHDRERLARLGVDVQAVREALTAEGQVAERIRLLAGLLWTVDEQLASATTCGYRATAAESTGLLPSGQHASHEAPGDDAEHEHETRARRRFAEFIDRHGRGLSRMAGSYARSSADREDLEQDIALALWTSMPKFRGDAKLETFAYRVARYCCFRHVRQRGPQALTEDGTLARDDTDLEQLFVEADSRAQLERALAKLPDSLESTVSLHLRGLSYAEIAEHLGISVQSVSVRLSRARARLRVQLQAA